MYDNYTWPNNVWTGHEIEVVAPDPCPELPHGYEFYEGKVYLQRQVKRIPEPRHVRYWHVRLHDTGFSLVMKSSLLHFDFTETGYLIHNRELARVCFLSHYWDVLEGNLGLVAEAPVYLKIRGIIEAEAERVQYLKHLAQDG